MHFCLLSSKTELVAAGLDDADDGDDQGEEQGNIHNFDQCRNQLCKTFSNRLEVKDREIQKPESKYMWVIIKKKKLKNIYRVARKSILIFLILCPT